MSKYIFLLQGRFFTSVNQTIQTTIPSVKSSLFDVWPVVTMPKSLLFLEVICSLFVLFLFCFLTLFCIELSAINGRFVIELLIGILPLSSDWCEWVDALRNIKISSFKVGYPDVFDETLLNTDSSVTDEENRGIRAGSRTTGRFFLLKNSFTRDHHDFFFNGFCFFDLIVW